MSCCGIVPDFTPHLGQGARCSMYWIGLREDEGAHALALGLGRSTTADVP